jgi:hypothetical protein
MKRVLCLAYLFPPIANSGTQRPLKFVKYLSRFGWEPTVMTAANFEGQRVDEGLLAEIPPGLRVVRVPMLNERIAGAITSAGLGTRLAKRIASGVSWRLQAHFRSPDLYALWRPTARRAGLQLFRDYDFDAIMPPGPDQPAGCPRPVNRTVAGADRDPGGRRSLSRPPASTRRN